MLRNGNKMQHAHIVKLARIAELSADDWYDIGCDLESSGMTEQAQTAYERALFADPEHPDAH